MEAEKRASIAKQLTDDPTEIEDMPIEHSTMPQPPLVPDDEIKEVKRSQEQVFDYMDVIKEQAKKLEQKLVTDDDDISALERKKKEIDAQRVKEFEQQLSKKREEELELEKQRIA